MADNYVAYVSTYTQGDNYGIHVYDVDMENGYLHEIDKVKISNSSYMTISHNRKYLYSITDFGVASYKIEKNGKLSLLGNSPINGMRGCYLSTDYEDRFLFVAGYHDGKITVLRVNEDGCVKEICDELFHKGWGNIAERNFRPHVSCVKMTRDNKFLCAADLGMDYIDVYTVDHSTGKLKLADIIHSDQESAPRHIKFSKDGKFMYVVHEIKNIIEVYNYEINDNGTPNFEKIQTVPTMNDYHAIGSAASALNISNDFKYILSTNSGDNSVVLFEIDTETGMLTKKFCLPISGDYPKDACLFPDNEHLVSLNHESDTMTFFKVNMDNNVITMCQREVKVEKPNCIIFHKLTEN